MRILPLLFPGLPPTVGAPPRRRISTSILDLSQSPVLRFLKWLAPIMLIILICIITFLVFYKGTPLFLVYKDKFAEPIGKLTTYVKDKINAFLSFAWLDKFISGQALTVEGSQGKKDPDVDQSHWIKFDQFYDGQYIDLSPSRPTTEDIIKARVSLIAPKYKKDVRIVKDLEIEMSCKTKDGQEGYFAGDEYKIPLKYGTTATCAFEPMKAGGHIIVFGIEYDFYTYSEMPMYFVSEKNYEDAVEMYGDGGFWTKFTNGVEPTATPAAGPVSIGIKSGEPSKVRGRTNKHFVITLKSETGEFKKIHSIAFVLPMEMEITDADYEIKTAYCQKVIAEYGIRACDEYSDRAYIMDLSNVKFEKDEVGKNIFIDTVVNPDILGDAGTYQTRLFGIGVHYRHYIEKTRSNVWIRTPKD